MSERSIFLAALDKNTPDERASYLEEACAGDPVLRQQVEALLQSHQEAGSFLQRPALEEHPSATQTEPGGGSDGDLPLDFLDPSEQPGSCGRLGHYEVLDVIGRGASGSSSRRWTRR
jgi:eukaryotic-like serine/threonine-protein kinase